MANNLLYTPFGYYLRVMVPKDLRDALGKREIKKSLTTLNLSCAIKAAQLLMPEIKHLFTSLRGRTMSRSKRAILPGLTEIIIRDRLDEFGRPYQEREMTVEEYRDLYLSGRTLPINLPGDSGAQINNLPVPHVTNSNFPVPIQRSEVVNSPQIIENLYTCGDSIQVKIDEYLAERDEDLSSSRRTDMLRLFGFLIEFFGDVPMRSILRKNVTEFLNVLRSLPTIYSGKRNKKYRGLTLREVAARTKKRIKEIEEQKARGLPYTEIPLLSVATVNNYITSAEAFWDWCGSQDRELTNPFKKQKRVKQGVKPREPFTVKHLDIIFHDKLFTNHEFAPRQTLHPHHFFVPLIGCYSGMRIEEICQLRLSDIKCLDEIWLFDINRELDKKVKNDSSIRKVPIHSALIKFGLLRYYEKLLAEGETLLFPNLLPKTNEKTGEYSYSNVPTVWFGRLLKSLNIKTKALVFHSFRHTFSNAYKQDRYLESVYKELLGHAHNDETLGTYSVAYYHTTLKEAIEALKLGIDMDFVKPWVPENFLESEVLRSLRRKAGDPHLRVPRSQLLPAVEQHKRQNKKQNKK